DLPLVGGDGRQRRSAGRGVTRSVDGRVRDALQVRVDLDAARLAVDTGAHEVEVFDLGHAAGAVHDQVRLVRRAAAHAHPEARRGALNRLHVAPGSDVDTDLAAALDEPVDEVGIEAGERPGTAVQDGCGCAGPRGHVGELEGD